MGAGNDCGASCEADLRFWLKKEDIEKMKNWIVCGLLSVVSFIFGLSYARKQTFPLTSRR